MSKKEQVKEKIRQAAAHVFAKYGLDKTTLEDIGRTVNLNKASLYYYYKNKEDIFIEVVLQESAQYIAALQEKSAKKKTAEEKITHYLVERILYYGQVLNLHQVSIETLRKVEPLFHRLYAEVLEKEIAFIEQQLKEGMKNGELVKTDAARVSRALMSLSDALKHKAVQESGVQYAADADYSAITTDLKYVAALIFNGLKK
jgi:TetR/AcrR family transcriptional regulator, biofilm operon repressor